MPLITRSSHLLASIALLCFLQACSGNDNHSGKLPETAGDSPAGDSTAAPHPDDKQTAAGSSANLNFSVVATFPHDTVSYTEGLLVHEGQLFESTGSPDEMRSTRSVFGPVDPLTGVIHARAEINRSDFGEGIAFWQDKVYQLTYKRRQGYIYNAKTFKRTGSFAFNSAEGWGLTRDSTGLIMSDGTNKLTWLDPTDQKPLKTLSVTENGIPVENLNELEYIKGFIYANIYTTDLIVKIDPNSGKVLATINLGPLKTAAKDRYPFSLDTNGIAYDPVSDKIYVTGKMWPLIFQISFTH